MVCLQCQQATQVINSRLQKRSNSVWRRRRCIECGSVFTTHETADYGALWLVSSSKQPVSPFSRDKLLISLYKSLQHRPTAMSDASGLTDTIILQLTKQRHDGLVSASKIRQLAVDVLERFDEPALVHYQAFHKG